MTLAFIRKPAEDRKKEFVEAGLKIALATGWRSVTHRRVAAVSQCVPTLVNRHIGTKEEFRHLIMEAAVARKHVSIVAEGLLYQEPAALKAPAALRKLAQAYIQEHQMKLPRWRAVTENGVVHAWAT